MAKYETLGNVIESVVRKACEGKEVGVVFSGGMDPGLITASDLSSTTPAERPCPELVRTDIRLRFTEPN